MGTPVLNAVEPDASVGGMSDFNATLKKGSNPDGYTFDWEDRGRTAALSKGHLLKGQEKAALQSRELEALMNLEGEQFRSFLEKERAAFAKAYGMPTYQGLLRDGEEGEEEAGPYSPFDPSKPTEVEAELRKVRAMVMPFITVGDAVPPELLRRLSLLQGIFN